MEFERAQAYARLAGVEAGRNEKALETAKNLLNEGISIEVIARCTGLTKECVSELKKQK